jgi:hypothetical protein
MIFAMAVLCAVALASTAEATWITAGGTLEFQGDGFENDTVGTDPSVTSVGSWYLTQTGGNAEVYGPASSGPGAYEGDNYLSLTKTSGNYRYFTACEKLAATAAVGTTIVTENSIYFPTGGGGSPTICFAQSTSVRNNRCTWVGFSYGLEPDGYLGIQYYDYGAATWTRITTDGGAENIVVSENAWHTLVHDMTVGTSFTMTIDGVVSDPIPIETNFQSRPVVGLHFLFNSEDGQYYVDAVPEPGSIVMLLSGACLGLLIWRRRSR